MIDQSGFIEFLKWLGQAAVIVVGWTVVHRLSGQRDRDKARREMVAKSADSLSDAVSGLLMDARQYHLNSRDVRLELGIKIAFQDLAMRVQGLSYICADEKSLASCGSAVLALWRSVTGQHFEDEHVAPLAESAEQLQSIADLAMKAKQRLLTLKHLQFPARDRV
jgi:hypothetical protein